MSRSVIISRPKVLIGRSQNGMRVGSSSALIGDGGTVTRRTGGHSLPIRISPLDNRVSPTRPVAARRRYPNRKEGDGGGGRGCRRKRRLRCNGGDRAATAGIPNPKGCRLPAGLSGAMRRDASTDGDVRQRKLNRPKDGCRKPPVRRNQDRESWLRKSEHRDKWSFCLTTARMAGDQERYRVQRQAFYGVSI